MVTLDEIIGERRRRYHQTPDTVVDTEEDALDLINELGFVGFINQSKADLPSLQYAVPHGYRNVTGNNPDEAKLYWDSKHTLTRRKACYYAKVIRSRGTFISWDCFPFFYSAYSTGNDCEEDYYRGVMSRDEKRILDLVAACPRIPSPELRRAFGPVGKRITRQMDRAVQTLQRTFKITVAGGSLEGWSIHYWSLVEDWVPESVLTRATEIDQADAERELILRYIKMAVAASVRDIAWVFQWQRSDVSALVDDLVRAGRIRGVEVVGLPGPVFAASSEHLDREGADVSSQ